MKNIFYFFIMFFLAKQSLALSLQEAYDIYNKSTQGKAAILLYTDGFIKGYAKGYTWKMIRTEKNDVNTIAEEYEKCFLKSKEEKLLKDAFSYLKNPKTFSGCIFNCGSCRQRICMFSSKNAESY